MQELPHRPLKLKQLKLMQQDVTKKHENEILFLSNMDFSSLTHYAMVYTLQHIYVH